MESKYFKVSLYKSDIFFNNLYLDSILKDIIIDKLIVTKTKKEFFFKELITNNLIPVVNIIRIKYEINDATNYSYEINCNGDYPLIFILNRIDYYYKNGNLHKISDKLLPASQKDLLNYMKDHPHLNEFDIQLKRLLKENEFNQDNIPSKKMTLTK